MGLSIPNPIEEAKKAAVKEAKKAAKKQAEKALKTATPFLLLGGALLLTVITVRLLHREPEPRSGP